MQSERVLDTCGHRCAKAARPGGADKAFAISSCQSLSWDEIRRAAGLWMMLKGWCFLFSSLLLCLGRPLVKSRHQKWRESNLCRGEPERPGRVPEVLLGPLNVSRRNKTKQNRCFNALSRDIGAVQVLCCSRVEMPTLFSSSGLFTLKKQLSLWLIIPDFVSLSSGFSPSLPMLLAVAFPAQESALIFKVSVRYFSQTPLRL